MTDVAYSITSPYYTTPLNGKFLDLLVNRKITKKDNDKLYSIDRFYHQRPDLLASDLYQDSKLWWVFAARNPDILKDPLFDFSTGTQIYLPTRATLALDLGF